jgi:hypothetical protein
MKPILITVLLFVFSCPLISRGQSTCIAHYIERDHIKSDTLTDSSTGVKFIIDKDRIFVKAIDKAGKQLWKTDPAIDNKLEEYRVKRPIIVYFHFLKTRTTGLEVIGITYNNSQFGYLDKKTGKFKFEGQD